MLIQKRYSSGLRYAHQVSVWQYPVLSAKNFLKQGNPLLANEPFTVINPVSWFFPEENTPAETAGEETD